MPTQTSSMHPTAGHEGWVLPHGSSRPCHKSQVFPPHSAAPSPSEPNEANSSQLFPPIHCSLGSGGTVPRAQSTAARKAGTVLSIPRCTKRENRQSTQVTSP